MLIYRAGLWPSRHATDGGLFFRFREFFTAQRTGNLKRLISCLLADLFLTTSSMAAVHTWTGAGPGYNWTTAANWAGGVPASGDTVIFPAGRPGATSTNDIADLVLDQVGFSGSNYLVYGNPITLTNTIYSSAVRGTNQLSLNLSLATANLLAQATANNTLVLAGTISGALGVTKLGAGTVTYQSPGNNPYTGLTQVNEGELVLNVAGVNAFMGDLIIGQAGGTGYPSVRLAQSVEIPDTASVTINNPSSLDLDGHSETFGRLVLAGGGVNGLSGSLSLNSSNAITALSSPATSFITGRLQLYGSRAIIQTQGDLNLSASIEGTADLIKTGARFLKLYGSNSFTGLAVVAEGGLWASHPFALGGTNAGTVVSNGASLIFPGDIGITNETLTLNGAGISTSWGALDAEGSGTNTWAGPLLLNAPSTIYPYETNSGIRLCGPITGPGGVILPGRGGLSGLLSFEGPASNSYAGGTEVDGGTLVLDRSCTNSTIPGSLLVLGGSVAALRPFQIAPAAEVTLQAPGRLAVTNQAAFDHLLGNGTVALNQAALALYHEKGDSVFSGLLSGLGSCFKMGSHNFVFTGTNNTSGDTYVWGYGTVWSSGQWNCSEVIISYSSHFVGYGAFPSLWLGQTSAPGELMVASNGTAPARLTCTNLVLTGEGLLTLPIQGAQPGSGYSQIQILGGTNRIDYATLNLQLSPASPIQPGDQFRIIDNQSANPIAGQFFGLPNGSLYDINGFRFLVRYDGGDGNDVVLTLQDVPASGALASAMGAYGFSIEGNGCNALWLGVSNQTAATLPGGRACLSISNTTASAWVTQPYATYPEIPPHACVTNLSPFQIATDLQNCGINLDLQLTLHAGASGTFTLPITAHTGAGSGVWSSCYLNGNQAIPDVGTLESSNYAVLSTPIAKVRVGLWLTHALMQDLSLWLIGPDGTTVPLVLTNGASGTSFGAGYSPDTALAWFDDNASTTLAQSASPYLGSNRPAGPLSQFIGKSGTGYWRLRVTDAFGGTLGTLRGWSLQLESATCRNASPLCDSCQPRFTNAITAADPTMPYHPMGASPSTYGAPRGWPGQLYGPFHYQTYTFTNTAPDEACVTVQLASSLWQSVAAAAYLDTYSPAQPSANYLGDSCYGTYSRGEAAFSIAVPAGARFQVIAFETIANQGCTNYTLQLSGLPCPPPVLVGGAENTAPPAMSLAWPSWAGDYLLEFTPTLSPAKWSPITDWKQRNLIPAIKGTNYTVSLPTTNAPASGFYRLHRP
jgi:autotransporter-associated beta strand protein